MSSTEDRWLEDLGAALPPDVSHQLGTFLGRSPVETLREAAEELGALSGPEPLAVGELCLVDGPSAHWGTVGGTRYDFACFFDAVLLAGIVDEPVELGTESPESEPITARVDGSEDLTVKPGSSVFSLGIGDDVDPPANDTPTLADGYQTICPYVRAFLDRSAYDRWADSVPAATVAFPPGQAVDLAAILVG